MELGDLKDKKIALLGVGLENISLAGFIFELGIRNYELRDLRTSDDILADLDDEKASKLKKLLKDHKMVSGEDYLKDLNQYDVVFRTPGIPFLTPEIQEAKDRGTIISSQIKLFFDLCPAMIIGVTGTKGKGTTASLISRILTKNVKAQNPNDKLKKQIYLLGNIGEAAVDHLKSITKDDIVILELSSFQLQDLDKSPHIAVITNLGEDHLNYHKDLAEYWESKSNILRFQSRDDFAVINQDYLTAFELASQTDARIHYFSGKNRVDDGAYVKQIQNPKSKIQNNEVVITMLGKEEVLCKSEELKIVGQHNLENISSAVIVGKLLDVKTEVIREAVLSFKGLEHRLEFVAEKRGVKYFNDSYATNPLSTLAAIGSFDQPMILILGGSEKGIDYVQFANEIVKNKLIRAVVYIGQTGETIASLLKNKKYSGRLSPGGEKIGEMIKVATSFSNRGDVVLFSPASASFGLFKNYKDRGEKFKDAVNSLNSKL